jgi:protein SCO1
MKLKPNKIFAAAIIALAFTTCTQPKNNLLLPVYGEKKAVDGDTLYHSIGSFALINQFGESITEKNMAGKIVIANFFFATCQSICPQMSKNMIEVQKTFENNDSVLILSHSVNPLHDTVEVLNKYSLAYGAKKGKWHFLTGDKKTIYDLAKNSYLVNAVEDDGTPEGFLHSELFLLIDTKGRIRGMYDGTDMIQVNNLINDINTLRKEH